LIFRLWPKTQKPTTKYTSYARWWLNPKGDMHIIQNKSSKITIKEKMLPEEK
jgi:hypothetical protein